MGDKNPNKPKKKKKTAEKTTAQPTVITGTTPVKYSKK